MQYNYVVSKLHLPPDAVQLCGLQITLPSDAVKLYGLQITFISRYTIIMSSPNYIYLPIQYKYFVSKLHLPPNSI